MDIEPFIFISSDRALQWVDLCSKALAAPREDVAKILANLCGFGSWDVMTYAIESLPPSVTDEELDFPAVVARLKHQILVLTNEHGLDELLASFLLAHLSPTSNRQYKAFTAEDDPELTPRSRAAFQAVFSREEDGGSETGDVKIDVSVIPFMTQPDPYRCSVVMELSGETSPPNWEWIFDQLGWDFDFCDEEHPDLDEPACLIFDDELGDVPIYFTGLYGPPLDSATLESDRANRLQRAMCVGDFLTYRQGCAGVALLLKRWPQAKQIGDQVFCHIGSAYERESNSWRDLLCNMRCTSISRLLELNRVVVDINAGHYALADGHGHFLQLSSVSLSGIDPEDLEELIEEGRITLVQSTHQDSGWTLQRYLIDGIDL